MPLLQEITLDDLTPARLWSHLPEETRRLAAEAVYHGESNAARPELDRAIAVALRFREVAVRKLPTERRIRHVIGRLHPDDSVASSLLMALHFEYRTPLMSAFLDHLGVPQEDGMIDESHELGELEPEQLTSAADMLFEKFDDDEVEVYLASLIALDAESWSGIVDVLKARLSG